MDIKEMAIYFTEEQFDEILNYMEENGCETVQDAVCDAIGRANNKVGEG